MNQEKSAVNVMTVLITTIQKVLERLEYQPSPKTTRLLAGYLLNIAAGYLRGSNEPAKPAVDLFHTFMTGTEEEQRKALQTYGDTGGSSIILGPS